METLKILKFNKMDIIPIKIDNSNDNKLNELINSISLKEVDFEIWYHFVFWKIYSKNTTEKRLKMLNTLEDKYQSTISSQKKNTWAVVFIKLKNIEDEDLRIVLAQDIAQFYKEYGVSPDGSITYYISRAIGIVGNETHIEILKPTQWFNKEGLISGITMNGNSELMKEYKDTIDDETNLYINMICTTIIRRRKDKQWIKDNFRKLLNMFDISSLIFYFLCKYPKTLKLIRQINKKYYYVVDEIVDQRVMMYLTKEGIINAENFNYTRRDLLKLRNVKIDLESIKVPEEEITFINDKYKIIQDIFRASTKHIIEYL